VTVNWFRFSHPAFGVVMAILNLALAGGLVALTGNPHMAIGNSIAAGFFLGIAFRSWLD
jgi:hypothetical protein